jgi:hypothetical protein
MVAQQSSQIIQQRVCTLRCAGKGVELATSFQAPGAFGEPKYSSHTGAKLELKKSLEPKSSKEFGAPTLDVA